MTIHKNSFRYFFFLGYCLFVGWGCNLEVIPPIPKPPTALKAGFSFTPNPPGFAPASVTFKNESMNAKSYAWYFDDGSAVSTESNPTHLFAQPKTYNVRLVAQDGNLTDTITLPVIIKRRTFEQSPPGFGPARKVIVLPTGEFVIAGINNLTNPTRTEAYILKTDAAGTVIPAFTKTFSVVGSNSNLVYDLIQMASDGSFAICGTATSLSGTNSDAFFARIKSDGTVLIPATRFGNVDRDGFVYSMLETSDGYITFCGFENVVGSNDDIWLTKRNPNNINGDVRFSKPISMALYEQANDLALSSDGGFMLFYTSIPTSGATQAFLLKTDAGGNQGTNTPKRIGLTTNYNYAKSIVQAASGKWLLGGTIKPSGTLRKGWMILTDALGNSPSEFPPLGTDAEILDTFETSTGDCIGVGLKGTGAWFVKTSGAGVLKTENSFGTIGSNIFNAIQPTADGGFIMVGEKNQVAYFVRTNAEGKLE